MPNVILREIAGCPFATAEYEISRGLGDGI